MAARLVHEAFAGAEDPDGVVEGHGSAEEVALGQLAVELAQRLHLRQRLDALGDHGGADLAGQ